MANAANLYGGNTYSFYTASFVSNFNTTAQELNGQGDHVYGIEHSDANTPGNVLSEGAPGGTESASSIDNNTDLRGNSRCGDDGTPKDMREEFKKIKKRESE